MNKQEEKQFETLYGFDAKNKIKEWKIRVINKGTYSVINYSYGNISGRKVECTITVTNGKNIGKRNQTTHFQQAILDATSKWKKKKESGYTSDISLLQLQEFKKMEISNKQSQQKEQENNTNIQLFPMLAQEYKKHKSKLKFPCYIQPKLDGYRMIYDHQTKRALTRTGKEFKILYDTPLYTELKKVNLIFDGELYLHNCKFENYGILRKTKALTEQEKLLLSKIEYHVYDILYTTFTYEERKRYLEEFFANNPGLKMIKFVDTQICENDEDIKKFHDKYISMNYEGTILRNREGKYKFKMRSFDLLKNKDFYDEEFEIVGFTSEREQNNMNMIVWICKKDNLTFNVRPKGDMKERQELFKRGNEYIGKRLWVKFFEYTDAGIPRFPTTMRSTVKEYIRENII